MKVFRMDALCEALGGKECLLGPEELGSASAYLFYGRLCPGDPPKELFAKVGCEEIVYMVNGTLEARKGNSSFRINAGEAFHIKENDSILLENKSGKEAVFISVGGECKKL